MKVLVIGSGIIGLTSAYHLLQLGHHVTLIDAAYPGAGASHGNGGWIVPAESGPVPAPGMVLQGLKWMFSRDSPLYIRPSLKPEVIRFTVAMARHCNRDDFRAGLRANIELSERTLDLYDSYDRDGIQFEMHANGLIMAFTDRSEFERQQEELDIPVSLGLDPQVLTGRELAACEPAMSPTLAGGIFFPHERHVRPDSLVDGLVTRCRSLGAHFIDNAPLGAVLRTGDRITSIGITTGAVEADAFLVAAGAHSGRISARFGVPLPVRPGKGYSVDYQPPPVKLTSIVKLCDAKVGVTPFDGTLRLAGTMEFASWDTNVNRVRVDAIRRAPAAYFADWPDAQPAGPAWAGARPMTPDGLPIIGQIPGAGNAYVATGHGMLGVTLGPATGALIAQAIDSGSLPAALVPFTPDRFQSSRFCGPGRLALPLRRTLRSAR